MPIMRQHRGATKEIILQNTTSVSQFMFTKVEGLQGDFKCSIWY